MNALKTQQLEGGFRAGRRLGGKDFNAPTAALLINMSQNFAFLH
jgi:hypothetical protein